MEKIIQNPENIPVGMDGRKAKDGMFKNENLYSTLIDSKWQTIWKEKECFKSEKDSNKPKYYALEMLPYPSGKLHMGHVRNYSIGDLIARFKRAKGFNVLYTMGWDAFGLPAENAAIENKVHPKKWTLENINSMKSQMLSIGFSYDWGRETTTCLPDYYKHEQAMFIDIFNAGLAYQKESLVNWDPVDCTVLANEQVVEGRGWRSGAIVEQKSLKQWFFKITEFADELLDELKNLSGWPEKVRLMQENWIGKSEGALVKFRVKGSDDYIEIFTTRPDTLYGASFLGVCYTHPILNNVNNPEVEDFISGCLKSGVSEVELETKEKTGIATGLYVVHPFDESIEIPVYVASFVLSGYGTGVIFGCPAHDERDHEFAVKYELPIKPVVKPKENDWDFNKEPYCEDGMLMNSAFLDGLSVEGAKKKAIEKLISLKAGESKTSYRLRDWGISRQRYWGCPIPVIHCDDCGVVAVPKEQLPVTLPEDVSFGQPGNPLDRHPTWKHVDCPKCGKPALRETDTFDTFVDSSWYFARYCSPKSEVGIDKDEANYWLPVDQYIGGVEHAVMHLLYARFFTKALKKLGYININEPFLNLLTQGMVGHQSYKDKSGSWLYPEQVTIKDGVACHVETGEAVLIGRTEKMSKSKKNVISPDTIIEKYGADTARLFLLSDSPPERDFEWTAAGVEGAYRYLCRLCKMVAELSSVSGDAPPDAISMIHQTIANVTDDFSKYNFNRAIARIRGLSNYLSENQLPAETMREGIETVLRLLNPVAPHITEELWRQLGNEKILAEMPWPIANEKYLINDNVIVAVQVNGKMRGTITVPIDSDQESVMSEAKEQLGNVKSQLEGLAIKKVIFIQNKIINIICS